MAFLDDFVIVIFPFYYLLYAWKRKKKSYLRSPLNIKIYAMHATFFKYFKIFEM